MTAQEIKTILEEKLSIEDFAFEEFDEDELGLGPIKTIEQKGGGGQGDEWYIVFHFTEHNIYLKCDGYYQSYNGTEFYNGWDDCFEVKPKQVEVTIYENI
jgi:hypothetical protein